MQVDFVACAQSLQRRVCRSVSESERAFLNDVKTKEGFQWWHQTVAKVMEAAPVSRGKVWYQHFAPPGDLGDGWGENSFVSACAEMLLRVAFEVVESLGSEATHLRAKCEVAESKWKKTLLAGIQEVQKERSKFRDAPDAKLFNARHDVSFLAATQ